MNNAWTGGQYSLYRLLFGTYLLVHFLHLLPWAAETFSHAGMLADATQSPLWSVFPNVLALSDSPLAVQALVLSAAVAAIAFMLGWRDRIAAFWLWYVLACLFTRNPLIANPALPYVGWLLLAHLLVPAAPYGALSARDRDNPAGYWIMPSAVFTAAGIVLALSYSYSGYTKLLSPSWVAGDTLAIVLENPLARDHGLRTLFLALPAGLLSVITWFILYVELLYAPLALVPRLRPWLWAGMLLVQIGFLFLLNFPDLTIGMLCFHLFTFDPAWLPGRRADATETVLYDGDCGLCHRVVRFVLAEDSNAHFRFAPLGGAHFLATVPATTRATLPDSLLVQTTDGRLLLKSAAVIHLLRALGGLWWLPAQLLATLPRRWADAAYDAVGRRRHLLFRQPTTVCPRIATALRDRFLLDAPALETT
ncbi:MAG: DCC1-like thiol-disulfide oxidoreductase family protein [Moraxellaceae bacterium]|nr:DCC1-like thiol-disulfide oxidoreductase family protein [Moraxellaceae bacterium]